MNHKNLSRSAAFAAVVLQASFDHCSNSANGKPIGDIYDEWFHLVRVAIETRSIDIETTGSLP